MGWGCYRLQGWTCWSWGLVDVGRRFVYFWLFQSLIFSEMTTGSFGFGRQRSVAIISLLFVTFFIVLLSLQHQEANPPTLHHYNGLSLRLVSYFKRAMWANPVTRVMITILVLTASKGSSTFEFIRRVLSIHTNPFQALTSRVVQSLKFKNFAKPDISSN